MSLQYFYGFTRLHQWIGRNIFTGHGDFPIGARCPESRGAFGRCCQAAQCPGAQGFRKIPRRFNKCRCFTGIFGGVYPLVNVYITMENHHFQWVNSLYMAIFNSHVCLPKGSFSMTCTILEQKHDSKGFLGPNVIQKMF